MDAIVNNWVIRATYDDGEGGGGKGERLLEPIAFGFNKDSGKLVIRAWQREGSSKTFDANKHKKYDPLTKVPGYRLFRFDKFKTWKQTNEKYRIDRNFLMQNRPKINPNDRGMSSVIASIEIVQRMQFELVFKKIKQFLMTNPNLNTNQKKQLGKYGFFDFIRDSKIEFDKTDKTYSLPAKVTIVKNFIGARLKVRKKSWYKNINFRRVVSK